MRYRGYLSAAERQERSHLAKLVHRELFLQGSLVDSFLKCGKDNCWCKKSGKGHPACYLSARAGSKRKMIYVPKDKERHVRECVQTYKQIARGIAKISKYYLDRFRRE